MKHSRGRVINLKGFMIKQLLLNKFKILYFLLLLLNLSITLYYVSINESYYGKGLNIVIGLICLSIITFPLGFFWLLICLSLSSGLMWFLKENNSGQYSKNHEIIGIILFLFVVSSTYIIGYLQWFRWYSRVVKKKS